GVRGPDHRLHYGDRSNALPVAGAKRHRQLRQDRPTAAGPGRTDRLRPGQGPAVRRRIGDTLRVLQGTAHGAARGRGLATEEEMRDEGGRVLSTQYSVVSSKISAADNYVLSTRYSHPLILHRSL